MTFDLGGKVIVVTGAASGVGAAIAAMAAKAGAHLLVTDRNPVPPPESAGHVATVIADLADPSGPETVTQAALDRFGRIDGLVNAAALTTRSGWDDATVQDWNRLFSVNTRAPFFLMKAAMADMKGRRAPGSIVNILSWNAHCGWPDLAVYSATKGALQTLTKNAAHAHLANAIRVNGINLGWTLTPAEDVMQAQTLGHGPGWLAAAAASRPLGRLILPQDCARLALWLLSDASAPQTGTITDLEQAVVGGPP